MKIGILGGSFNPPHRGHIIAAQEVLTFTDIEKVWLMPCFAHTFEKPLASVSDRLAMTQCLESKNISVSSFEIDKKLDGETIHMVSALKKEYPGDEFVFLIGADKLASFTKWGEWERLLKEISFVVIPRPEYPCLPLYPGMKVLDSPLFASTGISSTMIRKRLAQGLSIAHLVPERVEGYIEKQKLYRF